MASISNLEKAFNSSLRDMASIEIANDSQPDLGPLVIEHDFRTITIPSGRQLLGVTSDENVNVVPFVCPRYYGPTDLSLYDFRINYQNANGEGDAYAVQDLEVHDDDTLTFTWMVGRHACEYAGNVHFIVCARIADSGGIISNEYNTAVHTLPVVQGLETDAQIAEDNYDLIEEFLQNLDAAAAIPQQAEDVAENTLKVEGMTYGTQDGEPVDSSSEYYHNNSVYYNTLVAGAGANALKAEGFAVGEQEGVPVASGSDYYHNNAEYYAGEASDSATLAASKASEVADKVLVSDTEPSAEGNLVWVKSTPGTVQIPTYAEFSELESLMSVVITPQQFDAAGDGTTDDTTALSTALNRSNAVIEGGNLSYKIGEIVLTERKNLVIRNFRFYHGISITLKHCENVIFQNCVWDEFSDNGIANKTVHCVILTTIHTGSEEWVQANNWRIDEVCKDIAFDHCQFLTTHFTESTPSLYSGTKPHYNTGMCIRLDGVDGLKVQNCYFTQNRGNACVQSNTYAPLGDFEFTNNFFYLNCWGGIELYRYTGISSYPTRIIQGNRFIGHGLGYLPWSYLSQIPEDDRGVGTAVLLGGNVVRIQNEPAHCAVVNNYFEDNNESSVEGWQWNPVKDNVILGNGVLQTSDSVTEMTQKYKITYQLYVRKNPSENPIYMHAPSGSAQYPHGETRSIENNTIGRMYGNKNPILIRGDYYEPLIIRNNTMTDEALLSDKNSKFVHILGAKFKRGLVWENNLGMRPYFNECSFDGGEYRLDELMDIYECTFTSQAFESTSKTERFQSLKSARYNAEYATLRDNEVSNVVDGKPVLGSKRFPAPVHIPTPIWDIRDEQDYADGGYVFGGETTPTILDTQQNLGGTDQDWTIFVDANTLGDNSAGNNTYLIKLLTFSNADGSSLSLEFGSRYTDQVWTWLFPNGVWNYDTTYQVDQGGSKSYLKPGKTARFVLRHKQGSGKIEVFAKHDDATVSTFSALASGNYPFTSGTAGTLKFGGVPNSSREKSYYNGKIIDATVYDEALTDAEVSMLMVGSDITNHELPTPVYDIADESSYVSGTGLTMDGTFAIDTGVALLEDTNDFTIVVQYQFENIGRSGARPNFTFIPVFSAMSADMASDVHTGHTDKGFDIGLSMQDGKDLNNTAIGGFMMFRRDWRYVNSIELDMYSYNQYHNNVYTFFVIRKDGVLRLYNDQLVKIGELTGDYATSIVNGNLTIGAKMGYTSGYTDFFKGVIKEFKVYDVAADLYELEKTHPSLDDNEASYKGAVKYHLSNKNNARNNIRYALVEVNYDLGEYNSAEYTTTYPKAFGIRLDNIYDGITWVPCSSSKRVVFYKRCKWDARCDAFEDWNIEIANPGIVPSMNVTVTGIKVLLLSNQEAIPDTTDATDFHISWDNDPTELEEEDVATGYVQFVPEDSTTGTTLTVSSEDTEIATVAADGQNVVITAVAEGETVIHVSIPYGTEYLYRVVVTSGS